MGINKTILLLMISICLVGVVSASYLPHKQLTDLEYSYTSNNATSCILTNGNTPYGVITINQTATRDGQTFTNTIGGGNFSQLGTYCFNIVCTDTSQYQTGSFCRDITPSGEEGLSLALVVILFLSSVLFSFFSWFFNKDVFLHILFLFMSLLVLLYAINQLNIPILFFSAVVVVFLAFIYYIINYLIETLNSFKRKRGFEF